LEPLEDRTLPSVSLLFDPAAGKLSLLGDATASTVREGVGGSGFIEVAVDGQVHSGDPASASFDPALAGATSATLTGIQFQGGAQDTLVLGAQELWGDLVVSSDAAVVAEDVGTVGQMAIQAPGIDVTGRVAATGLALSAPGLVTVEASDRLLADRVEVSAGVFVTSGQVHADGAASGLVAIDAAEVLDAGPITADGAAAGGDGGTVRVTFTDSYIATAAAVTSAGGAAGHGGQVAIDGGVTGHLFSSGSYRATGSRGGGVDLLGRDVVLDAAVVDASGLGVGGSVRVGGDCLGANPDVADAVTVTVTPGTTIRADALAKGDGGRVIVWSDQETQFDGTASARGGPGGGAGGFIEVSSKGSLTYDGTADAGAPAGPASTLLLDPKNLIISAAPVGVFPQFDLIDPHPTAGGGFGTNVTLLSNGNVVVYNPNDSFGGANAGAVYLFNGLTGALIGSLVGGSSNDRVGSSLVTPLSNGNYLVQTPNWNGNRGAVTWANGSTGVSGAVSSANSLVGSSPNDRVGFSGVGGFSNGNYLVITPNWNGDRGAVTWGNGSTGVSGAVSDANSLVGSSPGDQVGGVTPLSNGNYLVLSPNWNGNRGAVTWADGATGQTLDGQGVVTAQNSLVGRTANAFLHFVGLGADQQSFLVGSGSDGGGRVTVGLTDPNQFSYARGQAQTVTLTPDFLNRTLNTGTAVVLQASNDITIEDPILVDAGGNGGALTLQAGRSIVLDAGISTDNGALTLIANDTVADGVVNAQRDPGKAFITMAGGTVLDTGQGALDIELRNGAGLTNNASGSISLQGLSAGSVSVVNDGLTAASGVRVGAVTTTGPQSYSSPNGVTVVAGDLDAGASAITFTDSVTVAAGVGVGSGSGAVNFVGSDTQTLSSSAGARFSNLSHTGDSTLRLAGDLAVTGTLVQSAGTFDAADQSVTVGRQAVVTGGIYLAGTGVQTFAGGLVIADGVFTSSTGPMTVAGGVLQTRGAFGGDGTVDALTVVRGTVVPGTGVLTVAGAVSFDSLTTFNAVLNGADPEGGYRQLVAGGPVDLGGSTLVLALGFTPQVGDSFTLLTTSDAKGISGTFAGLGEGAIFTQGGVTFQITYQGGPDGKSVVVTRLA
jgi:hypothetical protein